jgi:hypothetical protein
MDSIRIAVIGADNAGVTPAAHAKLAGAPDVRLHDRHPHETKLVPKNGNRVELSGRSVAEIASV